MLTARDCLRIAAGNKFKRWIPATDSEVGDRRTAMARLSNHSYFVPGITPKFTLSPTDKVFTIGSCFARSIENALVERHIDVITAKLDIDPRLIVTSGGPFAVPTSVRTILNKYNTSAIRSELERVLEPRPIPDDGFVEVKPGLYIDPQLSMLKPAPMEAAKRTRATVETLLSSVRNADAVFITLGLTETWQDRKTGLYLNAGPPPQIMARESGRFLFVNSTVEHSFAEMERTITLIEKHSSKSPRFIVTVSPVPLNTTWTTMDVVVANTYS